MPPRGSGSADGEADEPPYQIERTNLLTAFFNQGKEMKDARLNVYTNNLYLGQYHFMAAAEVSPSVKNMLENSEKYLCAPAPGTDLMCFVHNAHHKEVDCVATGGTERSPWAIFRIVWDGLVGGATETVVAVFHLNLELLTSATHLVGAPPS